MNDARAQPRYRAIFLAALGPVPAHVAWAWQEAGHEILELWMSPDTGAGAWRRDRRLGWLAPQWSLSAAIRRWRIPRRAVAMPAEWRDATARIADLRPDLILSVFFPRLLPAPLLEGLAVPAINLHPTLLPRCRGPFPMVAMLVDEAVDRSSGVTAHVMTAAADAGPIIAALPVALPPDRNVRQWELALAQAAARLAVEAIPRYLEGGQPTYPQDETQATSRRPSTRDLALTPAATAARVEWLCSTVAWLQPITMRVDAAKYRIAGAVRRLGRPTGARARVGWRTLELDLADARVRLGRRMAWDGQRLRLATLLRRIATRPAWPHRDPLPRAAPGRAKPDPNPPAS